MAQNNTNQLSALIITLNEENNIRELIDNLQFADEIIVVDSYSTDKTLAILSELTHVKVFKNHFKDFASQRNFALSKAKYNWVLFIDADERITNDLKNEIIHTLKNPVHKGYFLKRKFFYQDKAIRFSGLQSDKNLRLFLKEGASYQGIVHEKLNLNSNLGTLNNHLLHYSYSQHEHFRSKIIYYNELKAYDKIQKGTRYFSLMHILHPIYTFAYRYIFRLGFLDGKPGYILCKTYAEGINARYIQMKNLSKS